MSFESPCLLFTSNGRETMDTFLVCTPDMVILDAKIADINVFETAKNIWSKNPSAKIIFMTESTKQWHLRQINKILPKQGVFGYINKSQRLEEIAYGVKCVFVHNNSFIDPSAKVSSVSSASAKALTDAEYETLVLMALGLTDRVMAERQNISVRGLQNRIGMIFQKLLDQDPLRLQDTEGGVINLRVRAVVEAIRTGLLDLEHFANYESEVIDFVETRSAN